MITLLRLVVEVYTNLSAIKLWTNYTFYTVKDLE